MKTTTIVSAIAAFAVAVAAAEELKIEVTHKVECERKTKKGDKVSMHYRGTLASDGTQFDASKFLFRLMLALSLVVFPNWKTCAS